LAPDLSRPQRAVSTRSLFRLALAALLAVAHVANASGELGQTNGIGLRQAGSALTWLTIASLYKSYSADGWISSILLQNTSSTPAMATLQFRPVAATSSIDLPITVPAFAVRQLYLGNLPELPDGFAGSLIVRQDGGQLVATANTRNARGNFSTYAAVPGSFGTVPDNAVYLPAVYNGYSSLGWSSSFVIHNYMPSPVSVEITYYDQSGPVKTIAESVASYESRLHYQPDPREGLPPGFHGSAIVRPQLSSHVAVVANVLATAQSSGDWLLSYEGIAPPP
jgi:hypothetical protein